MTDWTDLALVPWIALAVAAGAFLLLLARLVWSGAWSSRLAVGLGVVILASLGWAVGPGLVRGIAEAWRAVRGLEFIRPWWLVLLAAVPVVVLVGWASLSGLGRRRKWVAIVARAGLVACLALALAEPRIRRSTDHVTVLFVIDRSLSVPPEYEPGTRGPDGEPLDLRWERTRKFVNDTVRLRGPDRREDRAGVILFGRRPKLVLPPAAVDRMPIDERLAGPIDGEYTDLAASLKLALASFPEGHGKRVVLISDGNENLGRVEEQGQLARQQGVQIDVLPLAVGYRNENEVLVQGVEAPPRVAGGERLPVRVLVRNAHPTRLVEGTLEVIEIRDRQGRPLAPVDSPENPGPVRVTLRPGLNVFKFRARAELDGGESDVSLTYRATFVPTRSMDPDGRNAVAGLPGDRTSNNRASASVVARGRKRVLLIDDPGAEGSPHQHLIDTLRRGKIEVHRLPADRLPPDRADLAVFLADYDCVILANCPADAFATPDQMEVIRQSVADQGMGLVMVGGPNSFGPGGYQKTPVETALPVVCDILSPEAAGKGGLVLVMHASEMADGNRWQKEIAKLAVERLGPADMVGVLYYGAGEGWYIPFQTVGTDKRRFLDEIDGMTPGDMPNFDPFLALAADKLSDPKHGLAVKHCIIISDGDPILGGQGMAAIQRMAANGVTCSTVGVATHGAAEDARMKLIADGTKGNFYSVSDPRRLPSIYVREARKVSQSFLHTEPFVPQLRVRGGPTAQLPDKLPPLQGFVRTTLRTGEFTEMAVEGPPVKDIRFPVVAFRQYEAGRTVAFTSDARTRPGTGVNGWDRDWAGSDLYQKFWEQTINWSMRTTETGRLSVVTEYRDGRVRVVVEARDETDRPLAGVNIRGTVTSPRPLVAGEVPPKVEFLRVGPGRFEAEFPAGEAGAYFVYARAFRDGQLIDGARAGVTVPYSPEFADLEPNPALLRRLAELTGGTVYTEGDAELARVAKSGEVFRDAPKTVRALLPFWFWLVFVAAVLLVIDIAARRVSVEPAEVRAWAGRTWTRLRTRRAQAVPESDHLDRLRKAKAAAAEAIDRDRGGRRFEPEAAPPTAPPVRTADEVASSQPPQPVVPPPPPAEGEKEDFLTRMRKAKKRAQGDKPDEGA
jgi:uncharacterized membrane protein